MLKQLRTAVVFFQFIFIYGLTFAQPVPAGNDTSAVRNWKTESKKISPNRFELTFTATVSNGWQVYAPNQTLLEVSTTELKFADSSVIQQGEFVTLFPPKQLTSPIFENMPVEVHEGNIAWKAVIDIKETVPAMLQGILYYTYGRNDEFYPSTVFSFAVPMEGGVESTARILIPSIDVNNTVADCGDTIRKDSSLFTWFLLGLLGGLLALITPCIFPMIPLTVSFFTQKEGVKNKGAANAVLYGFFIFLIYVLLTIPFHIAGKTNPDIFNNISTNVILNLIFFAIFVVFALSFFGLFEITLPSGVANK